MAILFLAYAGFTQWSWRVWQLVTAEFLTESQLLPNSGHALIPVTLDEIVFFLEAAFSAAVFILLHQHLAIIPAKIRLEATVLCAQRVLMFGTVNLTF